MLTVALALEEGGAVPCISENDGVLREEVAVVDVVLHQMVRDRFGGSKCRLSIYARTGGGGKRSELSTYRTVRLVASGRLPLRVREASARHRTLASDQCL